MQNFRPGQKVRYIGSGFPDNSVKVGDIGIYLGTADKLINTVRATGAIMELANPKSSWPAEVRESYEALLNSIEVQHDDGGKPKIGTASSWEPVDDDEKDFDKDSKIDCTAGSWDQLQKDLGLDIRKIDVKEKESACAGPE